MSQWKNVGAIVTLSLTAALAGTGCLAESADDAAMNEPEAAAVDRDNQAAADNTGEAKDACCAGFGWCDLAALGTVIPGLGFGGFGPFFAAFGGCAGGCGGGFGGCGGCF